MTAVTIINDVFDRAVAGGWVRPVSGGTVAIKSAADFVLTLGADPVTEPDRPWVDVLAAATKLSEVAV